MPDDLITAKINSLDPEAAPPWMKRVPMITGALAAMAAFLTVRAATMADEAIYHSNQAVLFQTQASDKWTEFQADSIKKNAADNSAELATDSAKAAEFVAKSKAFADRQPGLMKEAKDFELQRNNEKDGSKQRLGEKDLLDYAGVAAQLGIALASIAALTRRREMFGVGVCFGLVGVGLTGWGLLTHYIHK